MWKTFGFPLLVLAAGVVATVTTACSEGGSTSAASTNAAASTGASTGASTSSGQPPSNCNETGAVVADPTEAAVLKEGGAPDLSCYTTPVALGAPETVTVTGCLDIFGVGSRAKQGLHLSVFGINQNPGPGGDTPQYGDVTIELVDPEVCELEGRYSISNVPTNTPLIYKLYEVPAGGGNKTAVNTYQYNVVLRSDRHRQADGTYNYTANMIYASTYGTIPPLAGRSVEGGNNLQDSIGRGIIAGEVRDCQGEGRSVMNATLGGSCLDTPTARITYFDGGEDPKPKADRSSTNNDGLFAVLNVYASNSAAGRKQEIEAKVLSGGNVVSAGKVQAYVFPDSVTIFSPQGLLPTQ